MKRSFFGKVSIIIKVRRLLSPGNFLQTRNVCKKRPFTLLSTTWGSKRGRDRNVPSDVYSGLNNGVGRGVYKRGKSRERVLSSSLR